MTNEVRIEISTLCDQRCIFCPWEDRRKFTRAKRLMAPSMFRELLDKIDEDKHKFTDLTISGFGEVFTHSKAMEMIEMAAFEYGYDVHVLTNGAKITLPQILKLVSEINVASLRFSLHAIDNDVFRLVTNNQHTYVKDVVQKIHYAIKLAEGTGTDIIITSDIVEENRDQIELLKDEFAAEDCRLEIWNVHNWGAAYDYRKPKTWKLTCGRPFNGPIQIQVDGTVNMCCFDFNGELLLGDLKAKTLSFLYSMDNPAYKRIVQAHTNGRGINSMLCGKCDQRMVSTDPLIYTNYVDPDRDKKLSTTLRKVTNAD
jgi:MoaA/NifB/PqqE/SkfB family radical SAM enzyme